MKKIKILILCVSVSFSMLAQKNELKKIEKLIKSSKFSKATEGLQGLEDMSVGTKFESHYYFLEGKTAFGNKKMNDYVKSAKNFYKTLEVELRLGENKFSEKSISYINTISADSYKKVNKLLKEENYEEIKDVYEVLSEIYPGRKDLLEDLLNCHLKLTNYTKAAGILERLLLLVGDTVYNSVNKETAKSNGFFTKEDRDREVELGLDLSADETKIDKKVRLDYYTTLVSIHERQENSEKEMASLEKAKKEYPDHALFYERYATAVYKTGDKEAYLIALEEALKVVPENKGLWYNLGVVSQGMGQLDKSVAAYDKVLELDDNFRDAYINKGLAMMSNEKSLIIELNKSSGTRKYGVIKKQIQQIYNDVIPVFEKAYSIEKDEELKLNLQGLYNAVGQKAKAKALE